MSWIYSYLSYFCIQLCEVVIDCFSSIYFLLTPFEHHLKLWTTLKYDKALSTQFVMILHNNYIIIPDKIHVEHKTLGVYCYHVALLS